MTTVAYPGVAYPGETYPGVQGEPYFTTPFELRPLTVDKPEFRPFNRVWGQVSLSVLVNGTSVVTVENPTDEQVAAATYAYLGGRTYHISYDEAALLGAAGYEVTYV